MKCIKCQKEPREISEYVEAAKSLDMNVEQYVRQEEGTYHGRTRLFCCTSCYIEIGMPLFPELREAYFYYRNHIEEIKQSS